jgi:3-hydroxyisobutyrate dehydrogenase
MGSAMARNLLVGGHEVRVWNRTREKAEPLAEAGARVCATPAEAASGAEAVITMLADGAAVEAAMVGGGALDALPLDALWVQMSTVGVAATERLLRLAAGAGAVFLDAPVLGSKAQAEAGELVVLASGLREAGKRARPFFDVLARKTVWLGEAGLGTRLKLVVNTWVLVTVENVAETVALAEALGLDPGRFFEAIEGAPFDMAYAHAKGAKILERDFSPQFPLELAAKDLRLVLEAAEDEVKVAAAAVTLAQFERALELGHGREDSSAAWFATQARASASEAASSSAGTPSASERENGSLRSPRR